MGPAGFPPSDEVVLGASGPQHPGSSLIARVGTPDDRAVRDYFAVVRASQSAQ